MKNKFLCILCILPLLFCSCETEKSEKIKIVTTLFPQYDFCRQIAGDKAEIRLLLPAGMESHNYEPSVADMLEISKSDIFVYTGEEMEPWAKTVIKGLDASVSVADASKNIKMLEDSDEEEEHSHHHEHDPHIWTDPLNAMVMCENILNVLKEKDPENALYYTENFLKYKEDLENLDNCFAQITKNAGGTVLCHGGRFSMNYFAHRYSLTFISAIDSCDSQSEPSASKLVYLTDLIRKRNIGVVFYEEITQPNTARVLCSETGAKMLLLHSCHNVTRSEFENGETYISLMYKNAENIKYALGVEQQND